MTSPKGRPRGSICRLGPGACPIVTAGGRASGGPVAGLPSSSLEVRIAAGRLDVMEFYSQDRRHRLREVLNRFGLVLEEDFDSPCG